MIFKQEVKNLLDVRISQKSMSLWASPMVVVRKHMSRGALQQICLSINYRKINSLLLAVTKTGNTKKGTLALMLLPKIHELFALLKEQSTSLHWTSKVVTTT